MKLFIYLWPQTEWFFAAPQYHCSRCTCRTPTGSRRDAWTSWSSARTSIRTSRSRHWKTSRHPRPSSHWALSDCKERQWGRISIAIWQQDRNILRQDSPGNILCRACKPSDCVWQILRARLKGRRVFGENGKKFNIGTVSENYFSNIYFIP